MENKIKSKTFRKLIIIFLLGLFVFPIYSLATNFKENAVQGFAELAFLIVFEVIVYLKAKHEKI